MQKMISVSALVRYMLGTTTVVRLVPAAQLLSCRWVTSRHGRQ